MRLWECDLEHNYHICCLTVQSRHYHARTCLYPCQHNSYHSVTMEKLVVLSFVCLVITVSAFSPGIYHKHRHAQPYRRGSYNRSPSVFQTFKHGLNREIVVIWKLFKTQTLSSVSPFSSSALSLIYHWNIHIHRSLCPVSCLVPSSSSSSPPELRIPLRKGRWSTQTMMGRSYINSNNIKIKIWAASILSWGFPSTNQL